MNETKHNKLSDMQIAGKKMKSTMEGIVTISTISVIIEQWGIEKFFSVFGILWNIWLLVYVR